MIYENETLSKLFSKSLNKKKK